MRAAKIAGRTTNINAHAQTHRHTNEYFMNNTKLGLGLDSVTAEATCVIYAVTQRVRGNHRGHGEAMGIKGWVG